MNIAGARILMIQQNIQLSVLMSTYEHDDHDYLRKAFKSLSKQSFEACEVVLVEDGPLNPSLESVICQYRQTLNIKSVKLPTNVGLGIALASGLTECSAPLVARMDTDDIAIPNRFELQYKFLVNNPEIALLGGHISEFENDPNLPVSSRKIKLTHDEIVKSSWLRSPFNHMTVMFRKDAILKAGNYQDVPSFEDYDLWLRVISAGYRCHNLDETLVYARIGNGFLKRRSGWRYIISEFKAVSGFKKYNVIPKSALVVNLVTRLSIRILPSAFIKMAYRSLRSKPDSRKPFKNLTITSKSNITCPTSTPLGQTRVN